MAVEEGWCPDPHGRHEERFFLFGEATTRVRDRGIESRDVPPRLRETPPAEWMAANGSAAAGTSRLSEPAHPGLVHFAQGLASLLRQRGTRLLRHHHVVIRRPRPVLVHRRQGLASLLRQGGTQLLRHHPVVIRRPRPELVKGAAVFTAIVAIVAVLVAALYSSSSTARASHRKRDDTPVLSASSSTTVVNPTTTMQPAPTTTTQPVPPDLSQSADQAANALVSAWAAGNQSQALAVATSGAVATLFAYHYQSGLAIDRGCNVNSPATCSFGPPGGGNPNDPLYSLTVNRAPSGGWYVSAVQVEGG